MARWRPASHGQLTTARRRRSLLTFSILIFIALALLFRPKELYIYPRSIIHRGKLSTSPPTYRNLRKWEDNLPQHNLSLPFPEGKEGRYVKFSNQIQKLGWNNVLNEVLMNAHLAYESERAYVFQDYVWKVEYYPWPIPIVSLSARHRWPHTPLPALIAGPTAGGSWDASSSPSAPRSVSEKYFDIVCPPHERRIIHTRDVKPAVRDAPGDEVFAHWKDLLLNAPERCIEVVPAPRTEDSFPQVFDLYLWGSSRILPLWESFSRSPTSRLLSTSPIVNSAVYRNEYLFLPRGPKPFHTMSHDPYERMMAMHIRRGDFKDACFELARWNSTFYSWNLLPSLPDSFTPPPGGSWGSNTPENTAIYFERCLPSFDAIVSKAREARRDYAAKSTKRWRELDIMYLLTNEDGEWLEDMKRALNKDGWGTIVTSNDLELDPEQTDVGMAVDMDIARRAAVFIGNGWSSFTSNVVHRRLVDGKEPISIRFW